MADMEQPDSPLQVPDLTPIGLNDQPEGNLPPVVVPVASAVPVADPDIDDRAAAVFVQSLERAGMGQNGLAEPSTSTAEISSAQVAQAVRESAQPTGAAADPAPPQIPLAPIKSVQARFNPLADGMIYLVVFVGGCIGTGMRYGLGLLMPATLGADDFGSAFHLPTFTANMVACFIFALLTSYVSQASWIRKRARQLTSRGVGMGMCGGFSTLSALAIEELASLHDGRYAGFAAYLLASFAGGLVVSWIGAVLGLKASARRSAKAVAETLARHQGTQQQAGRQGDRQIAYQNGGRSDRQAGHQNARHAADAADANRPFDTAEGTVIIHAYGTQIVDPLPVSAPPAGDYGQPLSVQIAAGDAPTGVRVGSVSAVGSVAGSEAFTPVVSSSGDSVPSGPGSAVSAGSAASGVAGATVSGSSGVAATGAAGRLPSEADSSLLSSLPSFEPAPITDEIPLTGDPTTGEVRG